MNVTRQEISARATELYARLSDQQSTRTSLENIQDVLQVLRSECAPNAVKDRSDLNDALLDLRARMLRPVSTWNAQARDEALTLIDRAIGDL